MSLNDLVTSEVSSDGAALKQVGFGVILIAAYHTKNADMAREYAELSEMVTDGFSSDDPAYRMASRVFMQDPRPPKIVLGRRTTAHTQVFHWTPSVLDIGYVHGLTIECEDTGEQTATVTNVTTTIDTVKEIVEAMKTALEALDDFDTLITVTEDDTKIIITVAAGKTLYVSDWTEKLEDVTSSDYDIDEDLDAILLENDSWYGVALDLPSRVIQEKAAEWVETNKKFGAWQTSDWQADDDGETGDIGAELQALNYGRSVTYYSDHNTGNYMALGGLAERFPHDPGSPPGAGGTWAFKTIVGVEATNLSSARKTALRDKNYITYITTAGRSHTLDGKVSAGEYADVVRFIDWTNVRIQEAVATVKLNAERVPYTDGGISAVAAQVSAVLDQGVVAGGWSLDPYPTVSVPKVKDVSTADKANRELSGVHWEADLAGAIHLSHITGVAHV